MAMWIYHPKVLRVHFMSTIRAGYGTKILVAQVCNHSRPSVLIHWPLILGAETASHIRENGRITILLHAFEGPARIVRLYGKGPSISLSYLLYMPPPPPPWDGQKDIQGQNFFYLSPPLFISYTLRIEINICLQGSSTKSVAPNMMLCYLPILGNPDRVPW